jgi:hypothetical protein
MPNTQIPKAKFHPILALKAISSYHPRNQTMEIWQAILLGIIEGITEYLPISSTGHLIVAQRLMGIGTLSEVDKLSADAFAICIQGGAILAVLGLYYKHVIRMIKGLFGQDPEGLKLAIAILVGFIPAAVLGVLLNDIIEQKLFGMWPVIAAWIVGGIGIIWTVSWRRKNPPRGNGRDILKLAVGPVHRPTPMRRHVAWNFAFTDDHLWRTHRRALRQSRCRIFISVRRPYPHRRNRKKSNLVHRRRGRAI